MFTICRHSFILLFSLCALTNSAVINKSEKCSLPENLVKEIASYKNVAQQITDAVVSGKFKKTTYSDLADFVDKFGSRMCGTTNLENAIDYMLDRLKKAGLDNVHGEEVPVPHWVRGEESATMVKPRIQNLPILGLGYSVGTPPGGIEAEAIVVTSFDELANKTDSEVQGKIVVYATDYEGYGVTVAYRSQGAIRAAAKGGVAALVRSVTPFSIASPHTGMMGYDEKVPKVPSACITVEDAHLLKRLSDRGEKIVIRLKMKAERLPPTTSRNTVSEIKGSSSPEKVVIVSGHLDSWDVGQGAMDDGGGAFTSWKALEVLKSLGLKPKRTLRSILWTCEEFGYVGARGYVDTHKHELNDIVFAFESDIGTFTPLGLLYHAGNEGGCIIEEVVKLLAPINATQAKSSDEPVESDIELFQQVGIPGAGVINKNDNYFWFHHSNGDTMDVENPDDLDKNTAFWAIVSYVIADLSIDFPRADQVSVNRV